MKLQEEAIDLLATTIRNTYLAFFNDLEPKHQFHFASRLHAWTPDVTTMNLLMQIKSSIMPDSHAGRIEEIMNTRAELEQKNYEFDINNYSLRKPFFNAYPNLLLVHYAIFKIRHWLFVYGVDERATLFELVPKESIEAMLEELRNDTRALQTLSTYAINVLYVYDLLYDTFYTKPATLLGIGQTYHPVTPSDIQFFIYYYTHCIIAATNFYLKPITQSDRAIYNIMLDELTEKIITHFDDINLDNKVEYLVCCRLLSYSTPLAKRIFEECTHSLSDEGSYLIDKTNNYPQTNRVTLTDSEHRNALFIMSTSVPTFLDQPVRS